MLHEQLGRRGDTRIRTPRSRATEGALGLFAVRWGLLCVGLVLVGKKGVAYPGRSILFVTDFEVPNVGMNAD